MSQQFKWFLSGVLIIALGFSATLHSQTFDPGATVEVLFHQEWVTAKLVRQNGLIYRVQFENGKEKWVSRKEIRTPGQTASLYVESANRPKPENVTVNTKTTTPVTPSGRKFKKDDRVEYKYGTQWRNGIIVYNNGDLYLLARARPELQEDVESWFWVHAYNIRKPGEDFVGLFPECQIKLKRGEDSMDVSLAKAHSKFRQFTSRYGDDFEKMLDTMENRGASSEALLKKVNLPLKDIGDATLIDIPAAGQSMPWKNVVDPGKPFTPKPTTITGDLIWEFDDNLSMVSLEGSNLFIVVGKGTCITRPSYRINLQQGSVLHTGTFPASSSPISISLDGTRIAGHAPLCTGIQRARLDVWDWTVATPKQAVSFEIPEGPKQKYYSYTKWAQFAAWNTIVSMSRDGILGAWESDSSTKIWQLKTGQPRDDQAVPVMSPGHQYVAVYCKTSQSIIMINCQDGQVANRIALPDFEPDTLQISHDGQYFMASRARTFKLWDLKQGESYPIILIAPRPKQTDGIDSCVLLDQGYVMMDNGIYDGLSGKYVWEYDAIPKGRLVKDMLVTMDQSQGTHQLNAYPLLPDHVIAALSNNRRQDDIPVDKIAYAIDMSRLDMQPHAQHKIKEHLVEKIKRNGHTVTEQDATMTLVIKLANGKSHKYEFSIGNIISGTLRITDRILFVNAFTNNQTIELERQTNKLDSRDGLAEVSMSNMVEQLNTFEPERLFDFAIPDRVTNPNDRPYGHGQLMP